MPLKLLTFGPNGDKGQVAALNRWADYIETQLKSGTNTAAFLKAQVAAGGGSGGGGSVSGVNKGFATLTFALSDTSGPEDTSTVVVVNASWVSSTSAITISLLSNTTDHPDVEDGAIEGVVLSIGDIIDGVSFEVAAYAPEGSRGDYNLFYIGV